MGWLTQPYYDKGKVEGEAKGEAKVLTRLLERRFGAVPDTLRQRIFAADVGSIDRWVERAFEAPDWVRDAALLKRCDPSSTFTLDTVSSACAGKRCRYYMLARAYALRSKLPSIGIATFRSM
jgi:hypothetical protein